MDSTLRLVNHTSVFRDHVSDEAEDSLLERWTKLGEAVLANGVPTEAHITEMTALAHSEQDQIKRKLRRTAKVFRAQPIEALVVAGFSI